ncbi:MAG TPA: hypothetical protein VJH75_04795 [Patescibacteria group bacterium]|nr:hypothetical protein [Patescibacteria group bacterium]
MVKALHIIPGAFDYFNDIRKEALLLTDALSEVKGLEVEYVVLEYGLPKAGHGSFEDRVSGRIHQGNGNLKETIASLDNYDLIHLHAPFLGGAKPLLKYYNEKKDPPPLVITYYRDVKITDLLSYYVRWYNRRYLGGLMKKASEVLVLGDESQFKDLPSGQNIVDKYEFWGDIPLNQEAFVEKNVIVYNNLAFN